eukprot:gnl/MRDRNA2_/MRDRNA2_50174_c0_seq1.p1 gnl/MRDRNA2_/MRDRNA2_50174_c0~~gnl/MRDRNA2_/MRDRNA2_50174_c0_seq1.p1  ORF type:complete len:128 (-),score=10.34 gnl/MRDRNA2_/MRDRNA2_50174_c0_seq1:7-390(-)
MRRQNGSCADYETDLHCCFTQSFKTSTTTRMTRYFALARERRSANTPYTHVDCLSAQNPSHESIQNVSKCTVVKAHGNNSEQNLPNPNFVRDHRAFSAFLVKVIKFRIKRRTGSNGPPLKMPYKKET